MIIETLSLTPHYANNITVIDGLILITSGNCSTFPRFFALNQYPKKGGVCQLLFEKGRDFLHTHTHTHCACTNHSNQR